MYMSTSYENTEVALKGESTFEVASVLSSGVLGTSVVSILCLLLFL